MINDSLHTRYLSESQTRQQEQALNIRFAFFLIKLFGILSILLLAYLLPERLGQNIHILLLLLMALFYSLAVKYANQSIIKTYSQSVKLETILNNISDGVLMRDLNGNFVSANPALLKMIPETTLKEMNFNGTEKMLHWKNRIFAIKISNVPEVGSVVIFKDQTRCRETEQARDSLIATVSHEFRTPLTAVMNYLEMLLVLVKMQKVNGEAFTAHLNRALENSHRLQNLVTNVIEHAQLQSGALNLKKQRFNLKELLEKNGQFLAIACNEKNLTYALNMAENLPVEIKDDQKRLQQALVILMDNAVKFTNQGEVKVNVALTMDHQLKIDVSDSGPGIPEEQLPDVFEAFRRASDYAQREHQGAGLGLSIARKIVNSMDGEISVASTLGVGSTFSILLPLRD